MASVQDPKHACKTASNPFLLGEHLLTFRQYYITVSHLALGLQPHPRSLCKRYVFNSRKRDEGKSYQTYKNNTFKISFFIPECIGFLVCLFIMGGGGGLTGGWIKRSIMLLKSSWHSGHTSTEASRWCTYSSKDLIPLASWNLSRMVSWIKATRY